MSKMKRVPKGTFEDFQLLKKRRPFPSLECLSANQFKEVKGRVAKLIDFHSKSKLAFQAVDYFGNLISEKGFKEGDCFDNSGIEGKKSFYKDPWQKSSMVIVNQGKESLTEGFHLVISHIDSPCLRVKPRPLRIEGEELETYLGYLGIRLSTIPHGGIITDNWVGKPVKVMGYILEKNREKREIAFPGFVGVNSVHVDSEDTQSSRVFSPEKSLEIIVGCSEIKEFLKKINFSNSDDFVNSRLWAVPTNEMLVLDEKSLNLIVGYGHDNRTTAFSAVDAITKIKNNKYSSIVWLIDNEEISDPAPAGARGNFLEIILEKFLDIQEKKEGRIISFNERNRLYAKSRELIGDVTFAPYGFDSYSSDFKSSAKIGLGTAIDGGDIQGNDPLFMRDLRNLTESIPKKRTRICHQVTGQFNNQDEFNLWYSGDNPTFPLADKGISFGWVGIPCACLHSSVEVICPGDEYATSELYKRFFESDKNNF